MIFGRRKAADHITVVRAAQRSVSEHDGIRSLHSFSAGSAHDPANVAFGSLVGVDEHTLQPGAGFERHAHRGVAIVTWVVSGSLRHDDDTGAAAVLHAGESAVQIAGRGVQHVEANASDGEAVRFVQTTLLCDDDEPSYRVAAPPFLVAGSLFDVHRSGKLLLEAERMHLFVVDGEFKVEDTGAHPGDSLRVVTEAVAIDGTGTLLVLVLR